MKNKLYCIIIFLLGLFISGCAGTGGGLGSNPFSYSSTKTNDLMPGMTPSEVKSLLGQAKSTQFIGDKWVWKYSLMEYGKGWIPYYLVFGKENPKLESWYANEDEYLRQQELWLQAFPPTEKHEIKVKIE